MRKDDFSAVCDKMAASETVKAKMRSNLMEFSTLSRQLLEAIAGDVKTGGSAASAATEQQSQLLATVLEKLVFQDKEMQELTETALEMRQKQIEMDKVDCELERRTSELSELQSQLHSAEKVLEHAVHHGKQKLESIKLAEEGAVSPEELIRYAHCISQASSTVSPIGWQPSNPTRPYPQDIQMRAGALGHLTSPDQSGVVEGRKGEASGGGGTLPATAMRAAPTSEMWRTN